MSFRNKLSKYWANVQQTLFPQIERYVGELSPNHKKLISILELVRLEELIPCTRFNEGRPRKDRAAIARAYIAKTVYKLNYTKQLIEYLKADKQLRQICGWDNLDQLPSESKFSRAFAEFADISLSEKGHVALIKELYKDQTVFHVTKDSMPIEVREKHLKKNSPADRKKVNDRVRIRLKRSGEPNRRQIQIQEDWEKSLESLPKYCDKGMKRSPDGFAKSWRGYKLHVAVDDNAIPLSVIITSASLNDCEVAIPLAKKTSNLVGNYYDLMDAAYDHPEIRSHSLSLGHIPIIDGCPHNKEQKVEKEKEKDRKKLLNFQTAEDIRYKIRFPQERFNALFKDFHGGRNIIFRGHEKVFCHVMFGVLVCAATMLIKMVE